MLHGEVSRSQPDWPNCSRLIRLPLSEQFAGTVDDPDDRGLTRADAFAKYNLVHPVSVDIDCGHMGPTGLLVFISEEILELPPILIENLNSRTVSWSRCGWLVCVCWISTSRSPPWLSAECPTVCPESSRAAGSVGLRCKACARAGSSLFRHFPVEAGHRRRQRGERCVP